MSSGGTNNSCNGSPRVAAAAAAGGPTTTRRRVADLMDAERNPGGLSDVSDEEDESNGSVGGTHHHHHHYHHHNHHFAFVKYLLLLRRRAFLYLPETWLLSVEDGFLRTATIFQSLGSGRNVGRKIFVSLMLMVVILFFVKVSFLSSHVEMKRTEGGLLILQTFKDDWAMAQKAITETQTSMPKRVLERVSVSENLPFSKLFFSFPCLVPEKI